MGGFSPELCSICERPWPTDQCNDCPCVFHRQCHFGSLPYTEETLSPPHPDTESDGETNYKPDTSDSNSLKRKRSGDDHYDRPSKRPKNN